MTERLAPREQQVVTMLAYGYTNVEVAERRTTRAA